MNCDFPNSSPVYIQSAVIRGRGKTGLGEEGGVGAELTGRKKRSLALPVLPKSGKPCIWPFPLGTGLMVPDKKRELLWKKPRQSFHLGDRQALENRLEAVAVTATGPSHVSCRSTRDLPSSLLLGGF